MEKLWTTSEVARHLGVTELDVEQLVREGKLTGYKLGGRFLRFRPDQVEVVKAAVRFRPVTSPPAAGPEQPVRQLREFVNFYDFYVVSALLLAAVVIYLISTG